MELKELYKRLELNEKNGLFITKDNLWKEDTAFPNRVKRLLERRIKPDAFFCFDNKPLILFFDNPTDKAALHEAIWNFNECPIAIIIQNDIVEIFNGFSIDVNIKLLKSLGGENKLNDFSYFELVTGRTWELYKEHLDYKNRVDYHLLQNIKAAREMLVDSNEKRAKLVNAILGKVIFVRYLIDRKVKMKFDGKLRTWTNAEFCELLDNSQQIQQFFEYLEDKEKGFNGDLFPLSVNEYKQVRKSDYQVLKRLLLGDDIATNQPSLFKLYDFSIIPIEFISNVYELFIGQDNQKKEGAYYTPLFLVDYILKETVEEKLNKQDSGYNCKVLDPACGSGIFLVETLRKIIEKYVVDTGIDPKEEKNKFKTAIKKIAKENIFGIDKDESAVQIAIFSIYLTLLDYLEPAAIEDAFKFPLLLNTNFFHADFFDENAEFNTQLKEIEFDYILGNPPWMRGKGEKTKPLYVEYIEKRRKGEGITDSPKIQIGNKEIAQAFLLRSSDFSKSVTKCGLIVTSKVLYNLQSKFFRKYFLHNFFIQRVFELAPVRREVFDKSNDKAIAPACVLFFSYANGVSTDLNIIEHIALKPSRFFSLFKIFTINRTDFKEVQQSKLKEFDWLWKVLVYGSYLDFNFIKRQKDDLISIKKFILNNNSFVEGTGIQFSSDERYDSNQLKGLPFVDAYAIAPFFIIPEKVKVFNKSKVHRIRDERLFKSPMLLIRKGLDMDSLTSYCAISSKNAVFKDSVTSIAAINKSQKDSLYNIAAILVSNLFAYYAINTFSSIGIEREQTQSDNKYSLPYFELNVKDSIEKIEQTNKTIHSEKKKTLIDSYKIQALQSTIDSELEKINNTIYQQLQLNDIESSLIDYALNINRSLIIGNNTNRNKLFSILKFKDETLKNYASIFVKRFNKKLETQGKKFVVEVWHTNQIVGMFFKLVPDSQYTDSIVWENKQDSDLEVLSFLTKISSGKITDNLFVQKDIRGFEKDYFYIFKPNEMRLWHKAIGYMDVNEFADAILKAGRKGK